MRVAAPYLVTFAAKERGASEFLFTNTSIFPPAADSVHDLFGQPERIQCCHPGQRSELHVPYHRPCATGHVLGSSVRSGRQASGQVLGVFDQEARLAFDTLPPRCVLRQNDDDDDQRAGADAKQLRHNPTSNTNKHVKEFDQNWSIVCIFCNS